MLSRLNLLINRRILLNVFKFTDEDVEKWVKEKFNRFKPDFIYGYAGTIYEIAKIIRKKNIKIRPVKLGK